MPDHFTRALDHVARYGDTDIFPFPIEQHVMFDCRDKSLELLRQADREFSERKNPDGTIEPSFLEEYPPVNSSALTPVGYAGFRWATQIDPFWNVYFLAQVLSIADEIESERIPVMDRTIFSYRYSYDDETHQLFKPGVGWPEFIARSRELASQHTHMLVCDISDFYPRIYHHRLENALLHVAGGAAAPKRIITLLKHFGDTRSYGLPVGGPAARILSELLLNGTDKLLRMRGVAFCRFVDDYHIFANSKEDAFRLLVFLSEKLLTNEGLSLQKAKTRVLRTSEYIASTEDGGAPADRDMSEDEVRDFMRLHIRYDPYSDDPDGDYERTRTEVSRFNVVGMLTRELEKSRIHSALTKQLLRSVRFLGDGAAIAAASLIVDNLDALAPVFGQSMVVLRDLVKRIPSGEREGAFRRIRELIRSGSHITSVDINLMYAIRLLGEVRSVENEATLATVFAESGRSTLLRKDIILIMAKWGNHPWVSDVVRQFSSMTAWERRACIIASFCLRDEGAHWRRHKSRQFSPIEAIVRDWAAGRAQVPGWEIPV